MKDEFWKELPKYFGKYLVSNMGRIAHYKNGILNQYDNGKGYKTVSLSLCNNTYTKSVHRLVCKVFLDNPENKPQVNHKNYDPGDNRLINLEWCTQSENMAHSCKNGRRKQKKYNSKRANLLKKEVIDIRNSFADGEKTAKELSDKYGISQTAIYKIISGDSYAYL